jgi:hypothetical protein
MARDTRTATRDTLESAKDAGREALSKGKEMGTQAAEAVREQGRNAVEMAKDAACAVGHKAEDATAAAGHGIAGFGERIADKGPHSGFAGTATQAVGDTLQKGGHYIEEQKLSGMAGDVVDMVKAHPIPIVIAALGIGFLIGRSMKD